MYFPEQNLQLAQNSTVTGFCKMNLIFLLSFEIKKVKTEETNFIEFVMLSCNRKIDAVFYRAL